MIETTVGQYLAQWTGNPVIVDPADMGRSRWIGVLRAISPLGVVIEQDSLMFIPWQHIALLMPFVREAE